MKSKKLICCICLPKCCSSVLSSKELFLSNFKEKMLHCYLLLFITRRNILVAYPRIVPRKVFTPRSSEMLPADARKVTLAAVALAADREN